MNIINIARHNQDTAWKIIEETHIIPIWESIGAKINLVGSLKSGLLMKNRDIDFHIYTQEPDLHAGFSAIEKFARHPSIKEIHYKNLIDTEEECIEWHAWYMDKENHLWQLDMIHIRKGSAYEGVVENTTDKIIEKLTPETREAILQIKYEIPETIKIQGIEVYYAVLAAGIRDYSGFMQWKEKHPDIDFLAWSPE